MKAPSFSAPKCLGCNLVFRPGPANRATQRFCSEAPCRKASKSASDAAWRRKNPDYHRGSVQVERVRRWRAQTPGYWRSKRRPTPGLALQDFAQDQPVAAHATAPESAIPPSEFPLKPPLQMPEVVPPGSCSGDALQDFAYTQNPLLLGLISFVFGDALQESFVPLTQKLVERGRRELAQFRLDPGRQFATATSN